MTKPYVRKHPGFVGLQIASMLADGPMSCGAIAEALGRNHSMTHESLRALARRGVVEKCVTEDGVIWRLKMAETPLDDDLHLVPLHVDPEFIGLLESARRNVAYSEARARYRELYPDVPRAVIAEGEG